MIIGLTGTFASGKDTIADYLAEKKGFSAVGTGDIVREYAKKAHWPNTRDAQREMGNKLRTEKGGDFLVQEAIRRLKNKKDIVIMGIRQAKEAEFFKKNNGAHLVAVDAPTEMRFQRVKKRNRPGDPQTLQELREKENKEMQADSKNPNCQNISYCMSQADFKIINDSSFEDLYKKIDEVLDKISKS